MLVGVLRGMLCFMADLMREMAMNSTSTGRVISRYGSDNQSSVSITKDLELDISGRDVILVEDIVDSGMTLNYLLGYLGTKRPATVEVCALLDKRVRRLVDTPISYIGFEVPDEFVVGYGLDYEEKYRNLPFIGALRPNSKDS